MGGRKGRPLAGIALRCVATGDYLHNIVLGGRALNGEAKKRPPTPAACICQLLVCCCLLPHILPAKIAESGQIKAKTSEVPPSLHDTSAAEKKLKKILSGNDLKTIPGQ